MSSELQELLQLQLLPPQELPRRELRLRVEVQQQ